MNDLFRADAESIAEQPAGMIEDFLGLLAGKTKRTATVEDINKAAAAGWAGEENENHCGYEGPNNA